MTSENSTFNLIIRKQIAIHQLANMIGCFDIRELLKEYLFVDNTYIETRRRKDNMVSSIKHLRHSDIDEESSWKRHNNFMWMITWRFSLYFSGCQCCTCGGYMIYNNPTPELIAPRALCSCPGYHEWYQAELARMEEPLQLYL